MATEQLHEEFLVVHYHVATTSKDTTPERTREQNGPACEPRDILWLRTKIAKGRHITYPDKQLVPA
jgi:hypothetical protein